MKIDVQKCLQIFSTNDEKKDMTDLTSLTDLSKSSNCQIGVLGEGKGVGVTGERGELVVGGGEWGDKWERGGVVVSGEVFFFVVVDVVVVVVVVLLSCCYCCFDVCFLSFFFLIL